MHMTNNRIPDIRKRLGISQRKLADCLPSYISNVAMSLMETGSVMPNRETMTALCDALGCLPTDIYDELDLNLNTAGRHANLEPVEIEITLPKKTGSGNRGSGHDGMTEFRVWVREEEKAVLDSALQRLGYRSSAEWFREQYRFLLRQYQTALTFDKG